MKSRRTLLKRLFALALVLMLAVTSVIPSIAQDGDEKYYTVTINNNEGLPHMDKGQYVAYQIFAGRVDTDATIYADDEEDTSDERKLANTLADITWGKDVDAIGLVNTLNKMSLASVDPFGGAFGPVFDLIDDESVAKDADKVACAVAGILAEHNDRAFLQAFAAAVRSNIKGDGVASDVSSSSDSSADDKSVIEIPKSASGYYLIRDTKTENSMAISSYILDVVGNKVINLKASVPTVDKVIVNGENETKADSYGIGDTVNFKITGTLPANYADFSKYTYIFTDIMSKGFSAPSGFTVTIYDSEDDENDPSKEGYTFVLEEKNEDGDNQPYYDASETVTLDETDEYDGATKIIVDLGDLKTIDEVTVTAESYIVLTYSATLNSDAEIGDPGNPNKVTLTYSNNPNYKADGTVDSGVEKDTTHDTAPSEVRVYTYQLELNKVDEATGTLGLEGAGFYLSRGSEYYYVTETETGYTVEWKTWDPEKDEVKPTMLTTDRSGYLTVKGLDAEAYTLTEVQAPKGYNTIDPFDFVISATVDESGINSLSLTGISSDMVTDITAYTDENGEALDIGGKLAVKVADPKAPLLPFTGGIGTTIFYVSGGLLVLAAAIFAIKKSKEKN